MPDIHPDSGSPRTVVLDTVERAIADIAAGKAVVALLSDWFPQTTGEIIHVDGGYHAVGA